MKVSIVGPGALGCLFAARFARSGIQTTLVDHKLDRIQRLKQNGIEVETASEVITATPSIVSSVPPSQDLVIICVKSYSTSTLKIYSGSPVLTLQGGLGNVETLCSITGSSHVLAGTTSEYAETVDEGRVRHAASGKVVFGSWTSCSVQGAKEALEASGFTVELTDAPGQILWEKAAISAAIEPLSALLNVPMGRLLQVSESRQLMRDLVVESVKVASTEGYRFSYSLIERAEELCAQNPDVVLPMLQDVRTGRRTEIEALSGEILRRGQIAALPCPRTRMIWQLLKGLEQH
ncbi:MAG TPA: 2-dehydropantoate 2-reductase [Candidatus Hydrogenedentes bacterium]|nr:2-dehydropantoate 2-reductase [Candidatus Hydrogenedentota bacterium]HOS03021.1 2-dehydropantoate 2-reductase [Candidatus Hydrogenedentota bacterium]